MAFRYDLYVDQGSDYSIELTLSDESGHPLDYTGYDVYAQFKKGYGSNTSYAMFVTEIDPVLGKINLYYSAEDSSQLRSGSYVYDIKINHCRSDETLRVVEGDLILIPGVTVL